MSKYGKILITGGLGFIGLNIVQHIRDSNSFSEIILIDNKDIPPLYAKQIIDHPNIKYINGSILDLDFVSNLDVDFDYIIHAAAILGIKKVAEESLSTLDVNILGTRHCLELAKKQINLKRFLVFSTSEIYGTTAEDCFEDDPAVIPSVGKRWCYAASKFVTEQYTQAYSREHGINYTIIRPFNVYGPYRDGSNAMSAFINKALNNEKIEISGTGRQTRSWCYVEDFVSTLLAAMVEEKGINEVFNIGNPDNNISIYDLAKIVVQKTNSSSEIIIMNCSTEDVKDRKPNIVKAKELLSYQPQVILEDGVNKTIEWVRSSRLYG